VTSAANAIRASRPTCEGALRTAWKLHSELEIPVVAVPKTIDNDLASTDRTFGFDTAVTIATEAVDRLHSTAEAHQRVMVLEVMGRHAGWIATHAGIAGGADVILIPEEPFDIVQVARHLKRRAGSGGPSRSWAWPRVPSRSRARCGSPSTTGTSTGGPGWAGSASASPRRSSDAPGSRPG
jgi:6-phosphofructokinase 1